MATTSSPLPVELCDAWIAAAVGVYEQGTPLTLERIQNLSTESARDFWLHVQTHLSVAPPPSRRHIWPLEELLAQWESIRLDLVEFLKIYVKEWTCFRAGSPNARTCSDNALTAASAVYRWTRKGFLNQSVVSTLVQHEKWWSILKPLLMTNEMPNVGTIRPRSGDGATNRRVRPRLNPPEDTPRLTNQAQMKTAEVMQQRLELDIMSKSDEGLSIEAKEYFKFKRQQILKKLRDEMKDDETEEE